MISRIDEASAVDTEDFGSITGLVKPKLEKSFYSHPHLRFNMLAIKWAVRSFYCVW